MISNKNLFLASVLAIISTIVIFAFWDRSFSSLNVNVEMNRNTALKEAVRISKTFPSIKDNTSKAAIYNFDSELRDYIELKQGGKDEFQDIIDQNIYSPFYWSVRIFEENKIPEATFWFKPNGDRYGFSLKIPEDEEDDSILEDEALSLIKNEINSFWSGDFNQYSLLENSFVKQSNGRVDHSFIFEHAKKDIGDARFRLRAEVVGSQLSKVEQFTFIPEDFIREFTNIRSSNDAIAIVSQLLMFAVYILAIGIPAMILLYRKGWLEYKKSLIVAGFIALTSTLVSFNSFPLQFFFYDTATGMSQFILQQILGIIAGGLLNFILFAISFVVAESLTRKALPQHIQLWKTWDKNIASSKFVLKNTIMSYLIVPCFLAFVILFYFISQRYLGFWSPSEALVDPNYLAAIFPWYTGLAISLQAGFWEEMLFRALPLAAGILIGNRYKRPTTGIVIAMVIQSLIFGAGHANYPSTPSYARVVELILPSIMFGFVYLKMGVIFAAITHYVYDVVLFSLPIFFSSGYVLDKFMVIIGALIPLGVVLVQRYRSSKWNEVKENSLNKNYQPQIIEPKKKEISKEIIQEPAMILNKSFLSIGTAIFIIAIFIFQNSRIDVPIDSVEVNRIEAIDIAKEYINSNNIILDNDYEAYATLINGYTSQNFIWEELGKEKFNELLDSYILGPRWSVRFVNYDGDLESKNEEVNISIDLKGDVKRLDHKIPENRQGISLKKEEARMIADKAIMEEFNLDASLLNIVSEKNEQRPERLDWIFIYEDKEKLKYEGAQLRSEIHIAGDKVKQFTQYVFVPEEWQRMNRERSGLSNILNTILSAGSGLLLVVIFLFNGFRILFKNNFSYKTALIFTLLGLLGFVNLFNDTALIANLPTDQPIGNLKLITYVTVGFVLIVTSLFLGLSYATLKNLLNNVSAKISLSESIISGLFIALLVVLFKVLINSFFVDISPTFPSLGLSGFIFPQLATLNIFPGLLSTIAFNILGAKILYDYTNRYENSIKYNLIGFILTMIIIGFGNFTITYHVLLSIIKVVIYSVGVFMLYKYIIRNNFSIIPFYTVGVYYLNKGLSKGSFFGFDSYTGESIFILMAVLIFGFVFIYLMNFIFDNKIIQKK